MGLAADYVSFFFELLFRLRVIFASFGSDSLRSVRLMASPSQLVRSPILLESNVQKS
jgi:hypothetical protein